MKIGFIGLGIMGSRMAENLQGAGYEMIVYNRTCSKVRPLEEKGAQAADSPAQLGEQADVLFTMLASPPVVEKVALGEDGFLDSMKSGALWVDCSTVNPAFSRRMAAEAERRGVRFVDAPVAGTKGPAEQGELLIFAGGSDEDLETCRPMFEIIGRKTIHVGGISMGTSMKMVNNLLLASAMLAFSEAMVMGQSLGIEQQTLFEVLIGGTVVAPFISYKRAKIANADYEADFPLKWMHKDLQLAAVTGYEQGVALPSGNAAKEIYALASRYGLGDLDFSAIYDFMQRQGVFPPGETAEDDESA